MIRQKVVLDASPADVFDAYTDPKKHAAFTGQKATGTAKVGGKFTAGDGYSSGKYLELKRGKMIVHEWKTSEWPAGYGPSLMTITLAEKGKKTVLSMVQSKVPKAQVAYYTEGWKEFYWEPLKKYFAALDDR